MERTEPDPQKRGAHLTPNNAADEGASAELASGAWADNLARPSTGQPSRVERLQEIADQALAALADALDAGQSDALKSYLATMARFHRYSWGNVLLIATQKPDATLVAGFRHWNTLGRHVRKGERGLGIMAPLLGKRRGDPGAEGAEGEPAILRLRGFRVVYVFDVSQTEGKPLPEPEQVRGDPGPWLERLEGYARSRGIELIRLSMPEGLFGLSKGGRIELAQGMSSAQEFSVLAHELAHEMLHHNPAEERPTSKKTLETEAEAIAFVVGSAAGLDVGKSSSDYIHLYQGDKETLTQSLSRIHKAASTILAAILPRE